MNILITSAGLATAVNVINALRQSSIHIKIIAIDENKYAAGLYLADFFYIVPNTKESTYISQLRKIIRKERIDFIFPLHSSEIMIFSEFANNGIIVANSVILPPDHTIKICSNKKLFVDFMHKHKFPIPKTFKNLDKISRFPVFIKPISGSSSRDSFKVENSRELAFYTKHLNNNFIVQEFIDWDEVTVDCYVSKKGTLIACVPRYRLKIKDGKAVVSSTFYSKLILNSIKNLKNTLKIKGAFNAQFFYNKEKQAVKIIEINPRLSAGGLPLTIQAGVNIPLLMLEDFQGRLIESLKPFQRNLLMYRYLTELFIQK